MKKPLILGGLLILLFLVVSVGNTFFHLQTLVQSVAQQNDMNNKSIAEDKSVVLKAENGFASIIIKDSHMKFRKTYKEGNYSEMHENDRNNLSRNELKSKKTNYEKKEGEDYIGDGKFETSPGVVSTAPAQLSKSSHLGLDKADLKSQSITYVLRNNTESQQTENNSLGGDEDYQEAEAALNSEVFISRGLISGNFYESEINVVLSVNVSGSAPNGLIVNEIIPAGWIVVESTPDYNKTDDSSGEIKWLFVGSDVESMEIEYKIEKSESIRPDHTFSGDYIYRDIDGENIKSSIDGLNRV